ncbi:M4 family metallopeptidase [Chryseobacterium sp. PBS4-4]|uniref:M4 family metallopeptidase n=1 Tax=Chryseobacterium edaphi TaxID=2976532 RepID=A0ABT2W896_9FLAO|nr:M4 family metallopeptidase [Chryseobacterium edaphi]MCU7618431.1 M4 family metallopeptidase [Chryseobacterium edaphi]
MKNKLISAFLIPLLLGVISIHAQRYVEQKIYGDDGRSSFIIFNSGTAARDAALSDSENFFSEIFKLPPGSKMIKQESAKLFSDFSDEKYQLFHNGIKVQFANYTLHFIKGNLVSMNGEMYDTSDVNTDANISESMALANAVKFLGAKKLMTNTEHGNDIGYTPKAELVLLPVESSDVKFRLLLAYKFDIFSAEPFLRSYVYVDAKSGDVLLNDPIMKHAGHESNSHSGDHEHFIGAKKRAAINLAPAFVAGNAETRYSGTKTIETTLLNGKYVLRDNTRGNGINTFNNNNGNYSNLSNTDITDNDNNWTTAEHNPSGNNTALDVHWGVEKTYDYFKDTFNRNSYNNQGAVLNSYIHVLSNWENAAWTGSAMVYGDGASTFRPLSAFDVTAHELGHAICQSTAQLAYQRESGALNEGFSDIWGTVVENKYAPEKQNFLIGEDITKVAPNYLRSMSNPNSGLQKQPDTYKGTYWKDASNSCVPNQNTNDNCGVHSNSGVLNYWFYLLVSGGTGTNDIGNSFNVTGVGFDKAAKIAYRLETSYLTANSNYNNAMTYGIQTAKDLFGADSPEHKATQNAFYAVGLGTAYSGGGANPGTDTQAPTAPQLSAGSTTQNSTLLSWSGATDNISVTGYDVYRGSTLISTTSATSYTVSGLSPATQYTFTVKAKDAAGNLSVASNTAMVTTLSSGGGGNSTSYCTSSANSATDERIANVTFADINKSSTGTTGYENFTSTIGNVTKGNSYSISITPYWRSTKYSEAYAVYIDYNKDGDFTDNGELAWSKTAGTTSPVSGNITIPSAAITGDTRMRVIMRYNALPASPCGTYNYGQVEDYTLRISPSNSISSLIGGELANENQNVITVYPNPVKDIVKIKSQSDSEYNYQLVDSRGTVVLSGVSISQSINVESVPAGFYIINLENGKEKATVKIIKK